MPLDNYCAIYNAPPAPPPAPSVVCLHHTISVMTILCKGQELSGWFTTGFVQTRCANGNTHFWAGSVHALRMLAINMAAIPEVTPRRVACLKVLCSYQVTALSKFTLLRYLSEIWFHVFDSDLSAIYP